jgi:hypothetical protein
MDYYLKAESEEALWFSLISAGVAQEVTDDGVTRKVPVGIALDVIGVIYKGTGNMIEVNSSDMGAYTYEEQAPIEGFHANIRGELTPEQEALLPLIAAPSSPNRVWFD